MRIGELILNLPGPERMLARASLKIALSPEFSLPFYRILNVAVRIGLGKFIEESSELLFVLFIGFFNHDANSQLTRAALDCVRHVVEPVEMPINQNGTVGLRHYGLDT